MQANNHYRAVVFDYGGVLMQTQTHAPRHAWDNRLVLALGTVEAVVHGSEAWHQVLTGAISIAEYWQRIAVQLALTDSEGQQLARDYYSADQLEPTLIALIRRLRSDGISVGLLSNAPVTLPDELARLGIIDLFQPLVVSAHIGVAKPDAGAFQTLLATMQRPADEVIFIDDAPANIQAANALGIHGIRYTPGMNVEAAITPLLVMP